MKRGLLRRVGRLFAIVGGALALVASYAVFDAWTALGHRAEGPRRARMEASPNWQGGHFVNPQPLHNDIIGSITGMFHASPHVSPATPLPTVTEARRVLELPPASGLRVTWLGHSTSLVEVDGFRVLTDPTWSERASPLTWVGPRRWYAPPLALADLPKIDAVIVSHDHFDHLDFGTVSALRDSGALFIAPLGIGAHLAYWGVPEAKIVELDWWQSKKLGDGALEITCTPARHASGRMLVDYDGQLWAGWSIASAAHRVYYSGDTGLFPAMREIGARLGPFDLTMIEVGQYGSAWPDWHLGPEQAVRAHQLVQGRVMLPVHWGTFALAYHAWTEPIERALAAAHAAGVTIVVPRPGESFEPASPPPSVRWWPDVPWKRGEEDPIVSTQME